MSGIASKIISVIERYTEAYDQGSASPRQMLYLVYKAGSFIHELQVKEAQTLVKNNMSNLLGQLFSTFPEYTPPLLDKTKSPSSNKVDIVLHYSSEWRLAHDMSKTENMTGYLYFKELVASIVEEFLPDRLWEEVENKYKDISKAVEKRMEKYSEDPRIMEAAETINPLDLSALSAETEAAFPTLHGELIQAVEVV